MPSRALSRSKARSQAQVPEWDPDRRILWYKGRIVKWFRVPAENQERIIRAFDEQNWAPRIADPLPLNEEIDAKVRLNDAIRSLNNCQRTQLLRFRGDGTGRGITWEEIEENPDHP